MPKPMIHNPSGTRIVANEKTGMGNAQNVYFRDDVAKPSQVLVAAADPDTLQRIADVKQALTQRVMNGAWRAIGIALLGAGVGALLVYFGVFVSEVATLLTFVIAGMAGSLLVAILIGRFWIAVLGTGAALLIIIVFGMEHSDLFQVIAFGVWFLILGLPLYWPLIHGSLHASKYSTPMTDLLYTIEDRFKIDITGDGIKGDPNEQRPATEFTSNAPVKDIEININGEPVAHEPAIPHVVTRQVLIAPFNTERQTGLYTPAQALDFYILVSKEPRYMDRNNIYGHGLQIGSVPWRIDLTKNSHRDLRDGLYALGAIVRVSGKYKISGKTKREVATLIEQACQSITEEF